MDKKYVNLDANWIEDLVHILEWDLNTFSYSAFDKEYIEQQINRLKDGLERDSGQRVSRDALFFLDQAVQDVLNNPKDCDVISKERAWELFAGLSNLRREFGV